jgi:hypothetical protein
MSIFKTSAGLAEVVIPAFFRHDATEDCVLEQKTLVAGRTQQFGAGGIRV